MSQFIASGARVVAIEDFQRNAARAASGFATLGVGVGDAVAIVMRNDIPALEAMAAIGLLGAYSVPVNWHSTGEEAGYVIADSGAKVVLAHADLVPSLTGAIDPAVSVIAVETPAEVRAAYGIPDSAVGVPEGLVAWSRWLEGFEPWTAEAADSPGSMIYTSGTTGRPKGVRRAPASAADMEAMMRRAGQGFGLRPGMSAALTGPLYHSAPNAYARLTLMAGGSLILMPRFDTVELLRLVAEHRLSHLHMVPTMFIRLLRLPQEVRERHDLSSLEYVIHGAAPCPPEIKRQMIDWWGPVIHEYYGSTEAGLISIADSAESIARPGTVGRPMAEIEVRILDDDGRPLGAGETGDIYVSLGSLTDFTYHNNDTKRREIERDGLITNGDIGYLDDDGYLFLCDRKIDMVISGGVNIYPAEIEAVLIRMAGVHDCAVFGIPDPEFGEALAAAIEPMPGSGLSEAAVQAHMAEHLSRYKLPKLVTFHDAIPREDSGKVFKRKLREPYWKDAGRRI
ncbi:MAG: acyl-CoA synthetase [Alphaproteobacteria bacterium]|jgi:long-chain acyl-CoA synthetase|nr:acyl-CoA synthetase [Alphaproteobacteria bacterium]MDP6518166.1 acyl-CoA synthetase [Alphaproteobacteria bacterium]